MTTKKVLRPAAAFATIGVGATKGWSLIKEGKLDARKIGRATVITADSIEKFIDSLPKVNAA